MFRTLLVDNYDSYTYNLYHQIAAVTSVPPVVVANDRTTLSSVCRHDFQLPPSEFLIMRAKDSRQPNDVTCRSNG